MNVKCLADFCFWVTKKDRQDGASKHVIEWVIKRGFLIEVWSQKGKRYVIQSEQ